MTTRKASTSKAAAGKTTAPRKRKSAVVAPEPADLGESTERIVSRPDGFHWVALDGKQEFGPFDTVEEAQADMETGADAEGEALEPEDLADMERDIGIADWIDPDTGEPAEGQSPPHLERE